MTHTALGLQQAHQPLPPGGAAPGRRTAPRDEDGVLIHRVAQHDRQAFEVLYHRYARKLARYLSRLLRRPELVEEVLDDVMLVVWQNAPRCDPTGRFSTWLFGIAHHKALKALARSVNKPLPLGRASYEEASAQENPESMVLHQELRGILAHALATLSVAQRAVVELACSQEYSYQEIAQITGCPLNTVKTRMFHARRRLAAALAKRGLQGDRQSPG